MNAFEVISHRNFKDKSDSTQKYFTSMKSWPRQLFLLLLFLVLPPQCLLSCWKNTAARIWLGVGWNCLNSLSSWWAFAMSFQCWSPNSLAHKWRQSLELGKVDKVLHKHQGKKRTNAEPHSLWMNWTKGGSANQHSTQLGSCTEEGTKFPLDCFAACITEIRAHAAHDLHDLQRDIWWEHMTRDTPDASKGTKHAFCDLCWHCSLLKFPGDMPLAKLKGHWLGAAHQVGWQLC